ncbi:gpn2 [Symbiodinium sp. KB8]|nr:gpn2 [Symbiodinium sp. KB8]
MIFGQVVVGPPGSGKSTYCQAMKQFMEATGRPVALVNLDPANENPEHEYDGDISELICLTDVMEAFHLGPNGGLMYCIEYLEKNSDWLQDVLAGMEDKYVILDCPGQAEMYTHHSSVFSTLEGLVRPLDLRLVSVHLVDASHCTDPQKYVSAVLLSLNTMMRLELPAVNVLSKVDLLPGQGEDAGAEQGGGDGGSAFQDGLLFGLDFYKEASDLPTLVSAWASRMAEAQAPGSAADADGGTQPEVSPWLRRSLRMYRKLAEVVEDYALITFSTLSVMDKASLAALLKVIDRANGYAYGALGEQQRLADMSAQAAAAPPTVQELVEAVRR